MKGKQEMIAVVSILFSGLATVVALAAFGRIVFQGLPTVEFLVERDNEGYPPLYKLSVSNPTRRLLVLDYIEVLSPDTVTGFNRPEHSLRGTIDRVWDDLSQADRMKSVFCAVPAGETQCLEIMFGGEIDDEDFGVDFRLVWSKGLPHPDRWLMPRRVKYDLTQVKSRKLAATRRPN